MMQGAPGEKRDGSQPIGGPMRDENNSTSLKNQNSNPIQLMRDIFRTGSDLFTSSKDRRAQELGNQSLREDDSKFIVDHELKTIKQLPEDAARFHQKIMEGNGQLLDEFTEMGNTSRQEQERLRQRFQNQGQEISVIQNEHELNQTFEFSVKNFNDQGVAREADTSKLIDHKPEGTKKASIAEGPEEKVGFAMTKKELEEVLHEGPVKPLHDGAFEIKEAFMDMSSSDEDEQRSIMVNSYTRIENESSAPDRKSTLSQ